MAAIQKRPGKTGVRWRALVRRRGVVLSRSFATKALAQAWAAKVEAEIQGREYEDPTTLNGKLLSDLLDIFMRDRHAVGKPVPRDTVYAIEQLRRDLGRVPAAGVSRARVLEWCQERLVEVSGATITRNLALLSSVLKHARHARELPVDTTVPSRVRSALGNMGVSLATGERDRVATDDEIARILGHLRQRGERELADAAEVALGSAMRLGEIARIRWDDLDEARRKVKVRDRKNPTKKQGNDQWVPLLPERITGHDALAALLRQPRTGEKIFTTSAKNLSSQWRRAMRAVGIDDLRFHDLRHSALTRCARHGFDLPRLRLVSGHSDFKMLSRYVNLQAEDVSLS